MTNSDVGDPMVILNIANLAPPYSLGESIQEAEAALELALR